MFQEYTRYRVLKEFFDKPTHRFQLRELSRNVKLGLPSVINHVKALEKERQIKKVAIGNLTFYAANKENRRFRLYKKLDMVQRLAESGTIAFLEKQLSYPSAIILFGSCAYGEDTEKSDVDLAIVAKEQDLNLEKYEKELKRKIQVHFFSSAGEMKKTAELFNNIMNGIVLDGFVKVL